MALRVLYHLNTKDLNNIPEEARWAEAMGYAGLCADETGHDPFFPLLLAAGATSRVTLETRVAIAFPRSPMVLAYAAMDLLNFSAGRFRLGLGTQVKGHNERRFSVKWESPGPRLREYVQSLHAIWDNWQEDKKLDFHGRFCTFNLMTPFFSPGPSPADKPPVFISAINPYNCRVAGELCDGLALHPITSDRYLSEVIKPNIARGAKQGGRNPDDVALNGSGFVITGPDEGAIKAKKEVVRRRLAFYFSTRTYFPVLEVHGFQEVGQRLHELSLTGEWSQMAGLISDDMLNAFAVVGRYEEVADLIKTRYGGLIDEVVLDVEAPPQNAEQELKKMIAALQS